MTFPKQHPCIRCGRLPILDQVQIANGERWVYRCAGCPPLIQGNKLCETSALAEVEWNIANAPPQVAPIKPDSPKMKAAIESVRFLVNLYEDNQLTVPNDEVLAGFQKMIDNKVIDLFFGAVTFAKALLELGKLRKDEPEIIVPRK